MVGCVEPIVLGEPISLDWVALGEKENPSGLFGKTSIVGERAQVGSVYLRTFDFRGIKMVLRYSLLRSKYVIPKDTVSVVLKGELAQQLIERKLPFVVVADDATAVDFYADKIRKRVAFDSKTPNVFSTNLVGQPEYVRFVAITTDLNLAFRVFTVDVTELTVSIHKW